MNVSAAPVARYRRHLLDPGQPLCPDQQPLDWAVRLMGIAEDSGIPTSRFVISPDLAVPIPFYESTWRAGSARDCPTIKPAFMWHPLMWLPPRLAKAYQLPGDTTAEPRVESPNEWALRVTLELSAAGMYDPAEGAWMDIPHLYGIDLDTTEGAARMAAWVAGQPDDVLDSIDTEELLEVGDNPQWALDEAQSSAAWVRKRTYATTAEALYEDLIGLIAGTDLDDDDFCGLAEDVALTAEQYLDGSGVDFSGFVEVFSRGVSREQAAEVCSLMKVSLAQVGVAYADILGESIALEEAVREQLGIAV